MSNSPFCPLSRSREAPWPCSTADSIAPITCARSRPPATRSKAPAQVSPSSVRLLTFFRSTRRHSSNRLTKFPPDLRASKIASTADSPTPRTPASPKRIWSSLSPLSRFLRTTEKSRPDSFTSGDSTVSPIARASAMNLTTLSLFDLSQVISAAMNDASWWCLRYAVWYVMSPYAAECDLLKP